MINLLLVFLDAFGTSFPYKRLEQVEWVFDEGRFEDNIVYLKFLSLSGPCRGLYFIILICLEMTNQSNCH